MRLDDCPGSDHRAPRTGGSCGCGMVTVVPARTSGSGPGIREVLARCLDDGALDAPAGPGIAAPAAPAGTATGLAAARQERVDRVLAALAEAGLALTPRTGPTVLA